MGGSHGGERFSEGWLARALHPNMPGYMGLSLSKEAVDCSLFWMFSGHKLVMGAKSGYCTDTDRTTGET
jgi:hypothetical protein